MTAATDIAARVVAEVTLEPLPSRDLDKNARVHWSRRHRAFQALKDDAGWQIKEFVGTRTAPYAALTMLVTWRQCAPLCDSDQIIARLAAVRDAAQAVGLVANDAHVRLTEPTIERVKHRQEQGCTVRFVEVREYERNAA